MLLILVLITGVTKQNFFSLKNLSNISVNTACRVIIAYLNVPAFIGTLGMQLIVYGICLVYTNATPIGGYTQAYTTIATGKFLMIPYLFIIALVVGLVMWFIFNMTRHGKYMYAIGGNEAAAEVSGVNVRKTKVMIYMSAAILYAIAGFLLGAKSGGSSVNMGQGYELEAIAACTIGGVSVNGGIGRISRCCHCSGHCVRYPKVYSKEVVTNSLSMVE